MKNALILFVAAIMVLVASLVIGLCIRKVRFLVSRAERVEAPESTESDIESEPVGPTRTNRLAAEERARRYEERTSLSQQQRENLKSQTRERFGANFPEGRQRFAGMSQEEMTKLREIWDKMSDKEKQTFMAQMSEGFRGRQRAGGTASTELASQNGGESQKNVEATEQEVPASELSVMPQENIEENSQDENQTSNGEAMSEENVEENSDEN